MAQILIIDDDEFTREVLRQLLEERHEVTLAVDGADGLEKATASKPDLIICDIRMPVLDGFGVLDALRARPETVEVPFIFLSAAADPELQRASRHRGADEFLVKPVRRSQVLDTVEDRLRRAGIYDEPSTVLLDSDAGSGVSDPRGAQFAHDEQNTGAGAAQSVPFSFGEKSLLHVQVCGFDEVCASLGIQEFGEILTLWYRIAKVQIERNNGWVVEEGGDSLLAQFDSLPKQRGSGSRGAIDAGICLIVFARRLDARLRQRFGERLPHGFSIRALAHFGQVALAKKFAATGGELTVVGEAVDELPILRRRAGRLGWGLAASLPAARNADSTYQIGRAEEGDVLAGAGGQTLVEILGAGPASAVELSPRSPLLVEGAQAIAENGRLAAEQESADPSVAHARSDPDAMQMQARGYRTLRRISAGGMARIYLVRDERSGGLQILKFLTAGESETASMIRDFLHEFALLSSILHPQVVRIRDQWFADGLACIAMEYLPGGDLRQALDKCEGRGMDPATVAHTMKQIATGLSAIHAAGIIHRDLKPGNIMYRIDGSLVIADFGIAKRMALSNTIGEGTDILGTVYYASPEQAVGKNVSPASDLYSLGVIYYELLTGRKPYVGTSMDAIIEQHLTAPIPRLPEEIAELQQILDRLLAKEPSDRFSSALAVSAAIDLFAPDPAPPAVKPANQSPDQPTSSGAPSR